MSWNQTKCCGARAMSHNNDTKIHCYACSKCGTRECDVCSGRGPQPPGGDTTLRCPKCGATYPEFSWEADTY